MLSIKGVAQCQFWKMGSRHLVDTCYLIAMQVLLMLIIFNFRSTLFPAKCQIRSPLASLSAPAHANRLHRASKTPPSVWYYEHVFEHQRAKLRILTEKDGAPPLRSKIPPLDREITIISGTSRDRLSAVESTAMTWGGAFCLAVHVLDEADIPSLYNKLQQMHARVEARGRCRLDIQLVKEDGPKELLQHLFPVNGMRNIAWRMAETTLILLLDADFKPSLGMHESLTENEAMYQDLVNKATQEKYLFVVPAFEFLNSKRRRHTELEDHTNSAHSRYDLWKKRNYNYISVPRTKEELKKGWDNGTVDCFHCSFSPAGHEPTNFRKFFDPATTSPYSITYMEGFEPYLLVARESTPMYDERFRGYGKNKISQIYSCVHGHNMTFQVLPNAFIFEIPHPPSQSRTSYWAGKHESVDNLYRIMGLYRRFKTEVKQMKMLKSDVKQMKMLNENRLSFPVKPEGTFF